MYSYIFHLTLREKQSKPYIKIGPKYLVLRLICTISHKCYFSEIFSQTSKVCSLERFNVPTT